VLFCDLVGSTEIAAHLDPEEWREVVAAYHRAAAEAITRFGGHVAKYLGDGVMAYSAGRRPTIMTANAPHARVSRCSMSSPSSISQAVQALARHLL
jgi:class 3 adenylate cyclase